MAKMLNMKLLLGSSFLISSNKGNELFIILKDLLNKEDKIYLDFIDIKSTITAFFFSGYGQLFKIYDEHFLKEKIEFININEGTKQQIEAVEELSKAYYEKNHK